MKNTDFDFKRIAQGYKDRPFLHKQVIERFQRDVTDQMFENGLDVGCGAGLSCKALRQICYNITGADISSEMISVAREVCGGLSGFDFLVSRAEEIPRAEKKYDIVTVAGVVPWIDRDRFLKNLSNIIKNGCYVLLYDFCISDKMKDCEAYAQWWHRKYLRNFPKPFRNEAVWTGCDVEPYRFLMMDQVRYELEYEFELESFIKFMMLQSNVSAKIEGEGWDILEVQRWFEQSLGTIFNDERRTLIFTGYSWYMKAVLQD